MRPVTVILKFVFGQAPGIHLFADVGGDAWIGADEIEEAFLVGLMFRDDFLPPFVAGFGVIVIVTDVIKAEAAVIVRVGLAVGD